MKLQQQWDTSTLTSKIALGCSHTYGIGVTKAEAWPSKLQAVNFGVPGASSDLVAQILPELLHTHRPDIVYVLWPDWTRFEYQKDGVYLQSLPTDNDRIYFMEKATDAWLKENFQKQVATVKELCKDVQLVDLTLDELIPYIDYSDKWPLAKDNMHFSSDWHTWVADIFKNKQNEL